MQLIYYQVSALIKNPISPHELYDGLSKLYGPPNEEIGRTAIWTTESTPIRSGIGYAIYVNAGYENHLMIEPNNETLGTNIKPIVLELKWQDFSLVEFVNLFRRTMSQ